MLYNVWHLTFESDLARVVGDIDARHSKHSVYHGTPAKGT